MTTGSGQLRLAIVDDDSGFVRVLEKRLENAGSYALVQSSAPPPKALATMRIGALLLDPACLDDSFWDYLEHLRDELPGLAIVVCTQRSALAQRVRGLRVGADDWVTKPCHPEEIVARLEAVSRRDRHGAARAEPPSRVIGDLELRPSLFQALVSRRPVDLTRREFEVLSLLAGAEGRVLEREDIYQRVWGYTMARGDRSVDVFVRKLRSKIERASTGWRYIHTHVGIGYRFEPERIGGSEYPVPLLDQLGGGEEGAGSEQIAAGDEVAESR